MTIAKNPDFLETRLAFTRRAFLKSSVIGTAALSAGGLTRSKDAEAFSFEPYPKDDELETVVTKVLQTSAGRMIFSKIENG